jgi:hypothetical protein
MASRVRRSLEEPSDVLSLRPKAAELVFQVFGRGLHPELFEPRARREIDRGTYAASVAITESGHVISWRHDGPAGGRQGGMTLVEVATSAAQPLPQRRRLLAHRIAGERSDRVQCRGGATYQTCFQLERVVAELFWSFQEELVAAGSRRGLLHRFESGGRLSLGAVSWIDIETRPRSLLVQAFHTFPDDLAIVKSQSLFEIP